MAWGLIFLPSTKAVSIVAATDFVHLVKTLRSFIQVSLKPPVFTQMMTWSRYWSATRPCFFPTDRFRVVKPPKWKSKTGDEFFFLTIVLGLIVFLFRTKVQKPRYSFSLILNSCIIWTILGSSSYSNSVLCPPQYFNPIYLSLAIPAQLTEELSLSTKLTISIYESELVGLIFTLSKKFYNSKTARCCCSHAIARAHPALITLPVLVVTWI